MNLKNNKEKKILEWYLEKSMEEISEEYQEFIRQMKKYEIKIRKVRNSKEIVQVSIDSMKIKS